jgi:twitching motility protein PilT
MSPLHKGLITREEAALNASNPADFELKLRGISSASDSRWGDFDTRGGAEGAKPKVEIERFCGAVRAGGWFVAYDEP